MTPTEATDTIGFCSRLLQGCLFFRFPTDVSYLQIFSMMAKPRHFQFTIRAALFIFLVAGVCSSVTRYYRGRIVAYQESEAVVAILEQWGAEIKYQPLYTARASDRIREWIDRQVLGERFTLIPRSVDIEVLNARNNPATYDQLRAGYIDVAPEIVRLSSLRRLRIRGVVLSENSIATLATLDQLEVLYLDHNRIEGEWIRHLTGLQDLKRLSLMENHITDEDLNHLAKLRHLEELYLDGTKVSGDFAAGLKQLSRLKSLRVLSLKGLPDVYPETAGILSLSRELPACSIKTEEGRMFGGYYQRDYLELTSDW